jgi:predicted TIM-barrel fold metal-dependent hydrolase
MRTPWGELEVRDAHIHFFSHGFFSLLARQKEGLTVEAMGPILGWEMPAEEPELLAARWVQELDRHGVAQAVLIASLPGDEASVIAAVKAFPGRFYGYFFLNPLAQDAVGRAEQAFEAGMRGICLFPAMHGFSMHDERLRPVLELSAARGAVVFVHCGVLTVGVRKKLGLASPFDLRFSNPVDLHGIALRYPQVRFVIPHFGAGYFREALMVADLCPNVFLDTSSSNSWTRYQAPPLALRAVFERALEVAGPRRLLFGTDSSFFPRGWHRAIFDEQVEALEAIGVAAEDGRAIFGENLARLLGEPPP